MKNKKMRTERDALGSKEIPMEAYYGIQTARAAENFSITGYQINEEVIIAMGMIKKAAAIANYEVGNLSESLKNVIAQAADEIIGGKFHDQFIVDPIQGGAGTSVNMNANEVIANRALELLGKEKGDYECLSPNTHVNMSQSTNDTFPTSFRIASLIQSKKLINIMKDLVFAFKNKAAEFDNVIKMGRTHLQDAVPIRLGQEFEAYGCVIERDIKRIEHAQEQIYEINMGATAVGTGLNANPDYIIRVIEVLQELTELPLREPDNLVDSTQNTDAYTVYSSALKITMTNLSKIANDLRLMASGPRTGLKEINLPVRQPGSSIMPGKMNPVMAEVINQIAFQVMGNDLSVTLASEAGQFELNVMEPVIVFNLLQSQSIMINGLKAFTNYCIKDITANEKIMQEYVDSSIGIVTALNPYIGYEKTSKIAHEALLTGRSIEELTIEKGILSEEEVRIILDPFKMTMVENTSFPSQTKDKIIIKNKDKYI